MSAISLDSHYTLLASQTSTSFYFMGGMRVKRPPVTRATIIRWISAKFYIFFNEEITLFLNCFRKFVLFNFIKPA